MDLLSSKENKVSGLVKYDGKFSHYQMSLRFNQRGSPNTLVTLPKDYVKEIIKAEIFKIE